MEYTVKKQKFDKKKVATAYVFFENGDYVVLGGSELKDISVEVYDRLVRYGSGYCAVAASGYVELKTENRFAPDYVSTNLYDPQDYQNNRKAYIERRCLIESRVMEIRFYDKLNYHKILLGSFKAEKDGETLKLVVLPQPQMGGYSSPVHKIKLGEATKDDISCINFDFDDGAGIMVFSDEIKEFHLEFDEQLTLGVDCFYRRLKEGYIKFKLRKNALPRYYSLEKEIPKRKHLERRLCGEDGFSTHDISHIDIDPDYSGVGGVFEERIEVYDMKPVKKTVREEYEACYRFESGYAKKLKDRTIILTFGSKAKKLMKELCE